MVLIELKIKCICNFARYCQLALYTGDIILYSVHHCRRVLVKRMSVSPQPYQYGIVFDLWIFANLIDKKYSQCSFH